MNYAIVCLDETGSMRGQEQRVTSSLNEYVNGLPEYTRLTVFKFDSERWTTYFDDYKRNWIHMPTEHYNPGSMTPLFDSIAKSINHAADVTDKDDKVFIMIDTDGHENASVEETLNSVKQLVEQKKALGWEFWFMANSLDQMSAEKVGRTGGMLGMNVASNRHRGRVTTYSAHSVVATNYFEKE